jgi:hypothetical protein
MADVDGAPETSVDLASQTCVVSVDGSAVSHDFQLVPELDPNWPGLATPTGQMRADPERMREVVEKLVTVIGEVERVPPLLDQHTETTMFGPPTWAMASTLTWAHTQLGSAVTEYTRRILGSLNEAVEAIQHTISVIEGTEGQNRENASTVRANMGEPSGGGSREVVVF